LKRPREGSDAWAWVGGGGAKKVRGPEKGQRKKERPGRLEAGFWCSMLVVEKKNGRTRDHKGVPKNVQGEGVVENIGKKRAGKTWRGKTSFASDPDKSVRF